MQDKITTHALQCEEVIANVASLSELKKLVCQHDTFYHYSDDHSVYKKGESEWAVITNLYNKCVKDYKVELDYIWNKYYFRNKTNA